MRSLGKEGVMEATERMEDLGTFEQKRQLLGRNASESWEFSDGGLIHFCVACRKQVSGSLRTSKL